MRGYQGLIEGDFFKMEATSVSNIIQRGGTILKTARSKEFMIPAGREKAYDQLVKSNIDALVLIGGDGTFKGANTLLNEYPINAIGIPGTIDKDIEGTDYTIGFDTALNTAVDAIDKIRDTAEAHNRIFLVEVMGRDAGYIALHSGIACGAEDILIPEEITDLNQVMERVQYDKKRKKLVQIIVVAEGDDFGGAATLEKAFKKQYPNLEVRSSILGHLQRGGSPTCFDRVTASRMGYEAVNALLKGRTKEMIGLTAGKITFTPFQNIEKKNKKIDLQMLEMAKILST
jgi:6-phosphofructokinase 1